MNVNRHHLGGSSQRKPLLIKGFWNIQAAEAKIDIPPWGNATHLSTHLYAMYVEVPIFMKNLKWFVPSLLALCVASAGALKASAHEAQPISGSSFSSAVTQDQDRDRDRDRWDQAPSEYRDAQQRGFHEGVEAARHDYSEHRHADADDHEMYKHPPVEESARREFREGFREGYRRALEHMRHDRDRDDVPHF